MSDGNAVWGEERAIQPLSCKTSRAELGTHQGFLKSPAVAFFPVFTVGI